MASVSRDKSGTNRILFTDGDGERKAIRLGKMSVKDAESFRLRIESLLSAQHAGTSMDRKTAEWLAELPGTMHAKLVRAGLAEPREDDPAAKATLGELLDRFERSAAVKPATKAAYRQAIGSLREYFGDHTLLNALTTSHADEWHKSLKDSDLAPATVSKRVRVAKAIFTKAVKWNVIASSPFADLRAGSQCNPDRMHYVAPETIQAILKACPDDEWRAIIAMVRYAGLRCPSELVGMKWGDVNWDKSRLTVRSPKTAGQGYAVRIVPIAPELRPILLAMFDQADEGAEAVIPRLNNARSNLRTHFQRIIQRSGEQPWPRLFHNLRASCAMDWCERFPAHVVAGWLGHTPLVAARHYLTTRDTHFDMATGNPLSNGGNGDKKSGAKSGALVAQNAAQHPSALDRADSRDDKNTPVFAGFARTSAGKRDAAQNEQVGWVGFEPTSYRL